MERPGRNDPCPCGSGRKVKRCCGVRRGPSENELARAALAREALSAALLLRPLTDEELGRLWDDMLDLPSLDLSLQLPLPELVTPDLECLLEAVADDDADAIDDALQPVSARLDTPVTRLEVARNVLRLRDVGRIEPLLAAVAIVELASRSAALVAASLLEAAAVAAGVARTPGGLLLSGGGFEPVDLERAAA